MIVVYNINMPRILINNFSNRIEQFLHHTPLSERSGFQKLADRFLSQANNLTPQKLDEKSINREAIFPIIDEAKELERKALYRAVHGACARYVERLEGRPFDAEISEHQISADQLADIGDRRTERLLCKLCKMQGISVTDADIQRATEKLKRLNPINKNTLKGCLEGIPLNHDRLQRLGKELAFFRKESGRFVQDYQRLKLHVLTLALVLSEDPDAVANLRAHNLCMLDILRKALHNPAYQALKMDESNPSVRFLHDLCLASYSDSAAIDAYRHIGEETLKLYGKEESPLSGKLRGLFAGFEAGGVATSNFEVIFNRMKNFTAEIGQAVHAILSNIPVFLHLPRILQELFPQEDQRIAYENNPGALYTEKLRSHGKTVQAHTVYTPGPTVGFEGSPEFRATLQAMENRQHFRLSKEDTPFLGWFFSNLQNIASILENPQSVGLMQLIEEFPDSYGGITLAQDTPMMRGVDDEKRVLESTYREAFFQSLIHPDNYTLRHRKTHPGGGYYFPIPPNQRLEWEKAIKTIVEDAYRTMEPYASLPPKTVLSTFRDLAHLGIMSHYQKMFVDRLAEKATGDFQILESHICRSGIDRGGEINAELLFASPPKDSLQISEEMVAGVSYARAFLTRRRLIIKEFLERVADLTQALPREQAQQFMQRRAYNQTTSLGIGLTY